MTPASWRAPATGRAVAAGALGALPWLQPLAGGPSPAVSSWLATAACVVALWALARPPLTGPGPRQLAGLALALVAWGVVVAGQVTPALVYLAGGLALVLLSAAAGRDPRLSTALQWALLGAAGASAVFGLLQYFGGAGRAAPWIHAAEVGVAYANLRQTNQYATLCWIGVAVACFGTLRLRPVLAAGLVALLAIGCAASASRTGLLALGVLAALCAAWPGPDQPRRLVLCATAIAAYAAGALLLPLLLEVFAGVVPGRRLWARLGAGETCVSRRVLWSNVLHLVAQRPLAGWGWGELDFAHYATLYEGARFCDILDHAHNLPLHLAVELGAPVAVLATAGLLAWVWRRRPWAEGQPLRRLAWALLALVGLHSLLEYPLWYGPFQLVLGLCIGWLSAAEGAANADAKPLAHGRWRRGAGTALLVAAVGYGAWDYLRVAQIYLPPEQRQAAWREDTLEHVRASWLFQGQARFADVTLATPTRANATWMYDAASRALHDSPEPRVIERVIESAVLLGRDDEAMLHLARYRAAFPQAHAEWQQRQRHPRQVAR
ncbi:PglL family O-oligosaccharyltransferase [Ramlibacter pallidus]|uniref:O-antigen ligase C-terminal domain-containing protein n=1 Tax=Ramlibacter pallidus TaxID=2780087 RepID=A0ABR9S1L0_9BURK|nr:Wzy polymerase domain-containing protein [Ramlibacter pallidus]MBE7367407.1 O-antigen ligase C-terminal domain-containing protein [Ramlibacter pallidus]